MDKDIIRKNFSKYAHSYDHYATVQKMAAEKLIDYVDILDKQNANILEIGCGTGIYTKLLINKYPNANINALDISPAMVCIAKEKLGDKINLSCEDGEEFVSNEKYDYITSNASMQWFNDIKSSLIKFKDLLSDKGEVVFSIFGPETYYELSQSLKQLMGKKEVILSESFISKYMLVELGKKVFRKFSLDEEIIQEDSGSLAELLKKIKYTGTAGGLSNNIVFTKGMIKNIEQIYLEKFGSIKASYQIFFCRGLL